MASAAASRMCAGVSKSGSPTTRLTMERPARRKLLARSAAAVLGDGLMRFTRLAIRDGTARPVAISFMVQSLTAALCRVQDEFCLPKEAGLMDARASLGYLLWWELAMNFTRLRYFAKVVDVGSMTQ